MTRVRCGLRGTGSYSPERILTNDDLSAMVDTSDEWITQRTGIRERRILAEDQSTSDMCIEAGRKALEDAGIDGSEIDLVILGTVTPDRHVPATACKIAEALGCGGDGVGRGHDAHTGLGREVVGVPGAHAAATDQASDRCTATS